MDAKFKQCSAAKPAALDSPPGQSSPPPPLASSSHHPDPSQASGVAKPAGKAPHPHSPREVWRYELRWAVNGNLIAEVIERGSDVNCDQLMQHLDEGMYEHIGVPECRKRANGSERQEHYEIFCEGSTESLAGTFVARDIPRTGL